MTALSANDAYWLERRFEIAAEEVRRITPEMLIHEMREALKEVPGFESLSIEYEPSGHQKLTIGNKVLEVGPMASNDEIKLALQNPFIRTENTRLTVSAIDRIKAKALEARNVAPNALKDFESDLDSILAEKAELENKRVAAVSPHREAIAGVKGELSDLKAAMDILTNGAPE